MARRARAVIGANFGDEGKGLTVDYLCRKQGAGVVVRFNGGAQAGHTVVTPDGQRHVFGHVGSGSFCGVPTYLSEFFVVNPIVLLKELDELTKLGAAPLIFASPKCLVTTFADMVINQRIEDKRGSGRHGSVGLGVGETIERSNLKHLEITMSDIWNGNVGIERKMAEICDKYAKYRTGKAIEDPGKMVDAYLRACAEVNKYVHPLSLEEALLDTDPIFEGAQGLLLDQDNKDFFPHVTRSNTGMENVVQLCKRVGISTREIETYYVSRTYLTRHGAGPLPGEDPKMRYADDTNLDHPYQGTLRFAKLDAAALASRCAKDSGNTDFKLVLTHCDQVPPGNVGGLRGDYQSYGPMAVNVEECK